MAITAIRANTAIPAATRNPREISTARAWCSTAGGGERPALATGSGAWATTARISHRRRSGASPRSSGAAGCGRPAAGWPQLRVLQCVDPGDDDQEPVPDPQPAGGGDRVLCRHGGGRGGMRGAGHGKILSLSGLSLAAMLGWPARLISYEVVTLAQAGRLPAYA